MKPPQCLGPLYRAFLLVSLITLGGCTPQRMWIRATFLVPTHDQGQGRSPKGSFRRVAVLADTCNPDFGGGGGDREREDIFSITCGTQYSILEAALTNAGLDVVSWRQIKEFAAANQLTYGEAALAMNVDSLLEVNELGTVDHKLRDLVVKHEYVMLRYDAAQGRDVPAPERPLPVDKDGSLERLAREHEANIGSTLSRSGDPLRGKACGASINIKLVGTKSHIGQWYFRANRYAPLPVGDLLVERRGGTWVMAKPSEIQLVPCNKRSYEQAVHEVANEMAQRLVGR